MNARKMVLVCVSLVAAAGVLLITYNIGWFVGSTRERVRYERKGCVTLYTLLREARFETVRELKLVDEQTLGALEMLHRESGPVQSFEIESVSTGTVGLPVMILVAVKRNGIVTKEFLTRQSPRSPLDIHLR